MSQFPRPLGAHSLMPLSAQPSSSNVSSFFPPYIILSIRLTGFRNSLADSDEAKKSSPCDLTLTIRALHHALAPGGRVFWRSAGLKPWYRELYEREGFRVE